VKRSIEVDPAPVSEEESAALTPARKRLRRNLTEELRNAASSTSAPLSSTKNASEATVAEGGPSSILVSSESGSEQQADVFAAFAEGWPALRERLAVMRSDISGLSALSDTCGEASGLLPSPDSPSVLLDDEVEDASAFVAHNSEAEDLSDNEEEGEVAVADNSSEVINWDAPDDLPFHERGFMRRDKERRLKASWK
jgi:hypothetical protein